MAQIKSQNFILVYNEKIKTKTNPPLTYKMHIHEVIDLIKMSNIKVWGLMCSNNKTMGTFGIHLFY